MNPRIAVAKLLILAAGLPAAVALAQNAVTPASEEVDVLGEFRVNTAKDDSFIATESAFGTRIATDIIGAPWSVTPSRNGRTVRVSISR